MHIISQIRLDCTDEGALDAETSYWGGLEFKRSIQRKLTTSVCPDRQAQIRMRLYLRHLLHPLTIPRLHAKLKP